MRTLIISQRPWLLLCATLIVWGALVLEFVLFEVKAGELGFTRAEGALRYFTYMTHLTNIGVAFVFTVDLATRIRGAGWPAALTGFRSALLVYALLIFAVYHVMLAGIWSPQGMWKVAVVLLHDVVPALYAGYWYLTTRHGKLRWTHVARWQLFPISYAIVVLLLGKATGDYPYPFLEIENVGWPSVLHNITWVLVGYVAMASLVVGCDKVLAELKRAKAVSF